MNRRGERGPPGLAAVEVPPVEGKRLLTDEPARARAANVEPPGNRAP